VPARPERIAPGVYVDAAGALHIDVAEMLEAHGYTDTPENRETLSQAAREYAARHWPGTPITED